jgi:hypothetical protein
MLKDSILATILAIVLCTVLAQSSAAPSYTIVNYSTELSIFANGTDGNPCAVQVIEIVEYEFDKDLEDVAYRLERVIPKSLGAFATQNLPTITKLDVISLDEAVELVDFNSTENVPLISWNFRADDPDLLDETVSFQLAYTIHGIFHVDTDKKINVLKWGQQVPADSSVAMNRISITLPSEWVFKDGEVVANTISGPIKLDAADKIILESNDILDFDLTFPMRSQSCSQSAVRTMGLASQFEYYHPQSTWLIGGGVGFVLLLACIGSFCCLGYLLLNEDGSAGRKRRDKLEPLLPESEEPPKYIKLNRDGYEQGYQGFGSSDYHNEPMQSADQVQLDIHPDTHQTILDFENVNVAQNQRVDEPAKSFDEVHLNPYGRRRSEDNV